MEVEVQHSRQRQRGFSLVEALVGILLLAIVMIAFLATVDASTRLAKSQGDVSDLTENLRFSVEGLVRYARMAGTGGLPVVRPEAAGLEPLALETIDNSDGSDSYGSRTVRPGTDVLIVRGVFRNDVADIENATTSSVDVSSVSPFTGEAQALGAGAGDPIVISLQTPFLVTPEPSSGLTGTRSYGGYRIGIVSSDPTGTDPTTYSFGAGAGSGIDQELTALNTGSDALPTFDASEVVTAGLLDQVVFFVADNDEGDPTLYQVRNGGPPQELVPDVSDLQVALGCDLDGDGDVEGAEWFASDVNTATPTGDQMALIEQVRIQVVARGHDPDPDYTEDFTAPENSTAAVAADHRHRGIGVRVALRSHPEIS